MLAHASELFPVEPRCVAQVARLMREAGCIRLYAKELSKNDDSKRQIYLTTDLSAFNLFPNQRQDNPDMPAGMAETQKPRKKKESSRIFGHLSMSWISKDGTSCDAKSAKLIYYPQYPEVRLSGFLQGVKNIPLECLREKAGERFPERLLFLGVTALGTLIAHLAVGEPQMQREVQALPVVGNDSVLHEIPLFRTSDSPRARLLNKLADVHRSGWIQGKRLTTEGTVRSNAPNAIGYTLEAELGVLPNGDNAPDFLGWEIKAHTVTSFASAASPIVTLFTPEPDVGVYADEGVDAFLHTWGYADRRGRPDRRNFGGIHRVGKRHDLTDLSLTVRGYDRENTGRVDPDGVLALLDRDGRIAAGGSFTKLLDSWSRKHNATAYVPALREKTGAEVRFHYGNSVLLCEGASFQLVLDALLDGALYLDPGIKAESWSSDSPRIKRRSQFRTKLSDVPRLYLRSAVVSAT